MNPPRWEDLDYIHFLIAAQKVFTGTEAARCAPEGERAPAHAAFTRLLQRPPPDTEALGQEAKAFVDVGKGLLVLDDTTLDKPDAQKMDRVTDHWSSQHPRVVQGIALWTLLWTEGKALLPWDVRVEDQRVCVFEEFEAHCPLRRVFPDPAEAPSSGESGSAGESADSGGGNPDGGAGGASEGLWARPGISDGFPKRGRGILGDQ